MFHFTALAILCLCSIVCVQSQTDSCTGLLDRYGTCVANAGGIKGGVDAQYCKTDCFAPLVKLDSSNCLEASTEICALIKSCIQECTPGSEECLEEEVAAYSCTYGSTFAENCTIACAHSGGDNDADDLKGSTSAGASTKTVVVLPFSAATLLVVAGLVF